MKKFKEERSAAFGPVHQHSTRDVKKFLLIDRNFSPATKAPILPSVEASQPIAPANPVKKAPHRSVFIKRSNTRPRAVSTVGLLSKSRRAYDRGELEEARRYYSLVQRADPSSTEAQERLAQIDQELR